jgi:N-acetylneuraminic acid mutarotase
MTHKNVVMITGGFEDEEPSKSCYLLDLKRDIMTEVSSMNFGRTGHIMLSHQNLVYVIGGVSENGSTSDSCEVFSPQLNV